MSAKIQKWGNSLGIRIPKTVIEKTDLGENSEVEIQYKDGNIIIMPIRKKYELKILLKEITENNMYKEDLLAPEGNEVW